MTDLSKKFAMPAEIVAVAERAAAALAEREDLDAAAARVARELRDAGAALAAAKAECDRIEAELALETGAAAPELRKALATAGGTVKRAEEALDRLERVRAGLAGKQSLSDAELSAVATALRTAGDAYRTEVIGRYRALLGGAVRELVRTLEAGYALAQAVRYPQLAGALDETLVRDPARPARSLVERGQLTLSPDPFDLVRPISLREAWSSEVKLANLHAEAGRLARLEDRLKAQRRRAAAPPASVDFSPPPPRAA